MDNLLGGDGSMNGIQTMGILNAMKTGNLFLDMTIAMCIPIALSSLFAILKVIPKHLTKVDWNAFFRRKSRHERFIKHSTLTNAQSGRSTALGEDSQNEILIKAIQLYLDMNGLLKLQVANLELKAFGEGMKDDDYYYYHDDETKSSLADTLREYQVVKRPIEGKWIKLGKFPNGEDDCKEKYLVELIISEDKEDIHESGDNKKTNLTQKNELIFHFRSDGNHSIDSFIKKAYQWYLDELRKLEDDSRYMYELVTTEKEEDSSTQKYKRYRLSDDKTFDSLFFQQKDTVLKIVNHFINKTGKYKIKGYPHKLGLLLHGPPGTGKTSLIKALAERTGRSIVNVPLARISTNAELASIFFDQKYFVEGENIPVTLGFKDIIFVMEDIDAVSKIVRRRDGKKTADITLTEQVEMPLTKSLWTMILESTNDSCIELAKLLISKSERLKKAAQDPKTLAVVAKRMSTIPGLSLVGENPDDKAVSKVAKEAVESAQNLMNDFSTVNDFLGAHAKSLKQMIDAGAEVSDELEDDLLGLSLSSISGLLPLSKPGGISRQVSIKKYDSEDFLVETSIEKLSFNEVATQNELKNVDSSKSDSYKKKMEGFGFGPTLLKNKDQLNLTGILNVLDGVVDTPGRMLVITTNHPEVLDPALIRPGRIDKKLMLGYMSAEDLISMVEHYFQCSLDDSQIRRLNVALNPNAIDSLTPSLNLTPAQVEQMASEFDELKDMITAIEKKGLLGTEMLNVNKIVYGD